MNTLVKIAGSKTGIFTGVGPHAMPTGFAAYCILPRVDDTQIKSVTEVNRDSGIAAAVTNETWESVALKAGIDMIVTDDHITSITLNAAGDSIIVYMIPYNPK